MQEEDLSKQVGFLIGYSKLKESRKRYKLLSSEVIFKSPMNITVLNAIKYMESVEDKLSKNIDLPFLVVYMHLLSTFFLKQRFIYIEWFMCT